MRFNLLDTYHFLKSDKQNYLKENRKLLNKLIIPYNEPWSSEIFKDYLPLLNKPLYID